MTLTIVEFASDDGYGAVVVEVDAGVGDIGTDRLERAGVGDAIVRRAAVTWREALRVLRPATAGVIEQFQDMHPSPDEVEVSFAISLSGSAGARIVSASGAYHLAVRAVWRPANTASGGGRGDA